MGRKKNTPQEWTDVPFPGMEEVGAVENPPNAKPPRTFDGIAKYRRHKTMNTGCMDCADEVSNGKSTSVQYAAFVRTFEDDEPRWLCFLHSREWKHKDQLAGINVYG